MGPGSERVGVAGAGKTLPASDWVRMALPDSRGFFELGTLAPKGGDLTKLSHTLPPTLLEQRNG